MGVARFRRTTIMPEGPTTPPREPFEEAPAVMCRRRGAHGLGGGEFHRGAHREQ